VSIDTALLSYVVKYDGLRDLQSLGIDRDHFLDENQTIWRYIVKTNKEHFTIPSEDTLRARFPDLELPKVKKSELPLLVSQARQRRKYVLFMESLNAAADEADSYESVDDAIQTMQSKLNALAFSSKEQSHLVNLFAPEVSKAMRGEVAKRRNGQIAGIPTGFDRFDAVTGGLQKQRMYTIIGRSGMGKSWVDLCFVASAVLQGQNVILYPLEMSLFEVATRMYTIFSQKMYGGGGSLDKVLKNHDLNQGRVSDRNMRKFLQACEERLPGSLVVADIQHLSDPYTMERVEAEVEVYKPDMFWLDYLTLVKPPEAGRNESDHVSIRKLSSATASIGKRHNVIAGCSAQVNRESIKAGAGFLPRLEHIAYGDSIGQDSDVVISIGRKKDEGLMYYSLVKNRGGPEFGKTKVRFDVNSGILTEVREEYVEDEG